MHLNRKHLSFLISFFSMSIIVLILFNMHIGEVGSKDDEYIVEMMLAEEDIEELLKEKERLEEMQEIEPVKSHTAFNETAKPSIGEPEPLQTLEEIMEERALTSNPDDSSNAIGDSDYAAKVKELAKKREEKKQRLGEKEAQKKEFTNKLADRQTSVSYSLVDRNSYKLPPPIYTCIEGGRVVINIKVDANGNVINAVLNEKSSGTTNGCLVDNAITYAYKAKFNSSNITSQPGSITYLFQQKAR